MECACKINWVHIMEWKWTNSIFGLFRQYEMCATFLSIVDKRLQTFRLGKKNPIRLHHMELPLAPPSLFRMRPYSIARSKQRWAAFRTESWLESSPLARTDRISSASLSISFSARLLSACMRFIMMTTPRCRRSGLSLSNRAWKISSQWLV